MTSRYKRRRRACKAAVTRTVEAHGCTADQVHELLTAALLTVNTWLDWGPIDDGSPEGDDFDEALTNLLRVLKRRGLAKK